MKLNGSSPSHQDEAAERAEFWRRLRIWSLSPMRWTRFDRIVVLAVLGLLIYLFAQQIQSGDRNRAVADERANRSSARACASYGADETSNRADETSNRADEALFAFILTTSRAEPLDERVQELVDQSKRAKAEAAEAKTQATEQKLSLRRELRCPPYPTPPAVAVVPGG